MEAEVAGGLFLDLAGNVIGTHEGYPFYTIGQRRGLGQAFGEPMYVSEIRPDSNSVILGPVEGLIRSSMQVYQVNSMKYEKIPEAMEVVTKVRYGDQGTLSQLIHHDSGMVTVQFYAGVKGVAPGQSAVFFEGDDVVGGGIIFSSQL